MNFEQPQNTSSEREKEIANAVEEIKEISDKLVVNMTPKEKIEFMEKILGNDFRSEIVHLREDKDIGRGVSMGEDVTSAYRDHLDRTKNGF